MAYKLLNSSQEGAFEAGVRQQINDNFEALHADIDAVAGAELPGQAGNDGAVLTTDGDTASWTQAPVLDSVEVDVVYLGAAGVDGSWRITVLDGKIQFQLRVAGVWTMKAEVTA